MSKRFPAHTEATRKSRSGNYLASAKKRLSAGYAVIEILNDQQRAYCPFEIFKIADRQWPGVFLATQIASACSALAKQGHILALEDYGKGPSGGPSARYILHAQHNGPDGPLPGPYTQRTAPVTLNADKAVADAWEAIRVKTSA